MTTESIVEWLLSNASGYTWANSDEETVREIILDIQARKGNVQSGKFIKSSKGGIDKTMDVGQATINRHVQTYEAKTIQPILKEIEEATETEQVNTAVRKAKTLKIPERIRKQASEKRAMIMERQRRETLEKFREEERIRQEEQDRRLAEIARRNEQQ